MPTPTPTPLPPIDPFWSGAISFWDIFSSTPAGIIILALFGLVVLLFVIRAWRAPRSKHSSLDLASELLTLFKNSQTQQSQILQLQRATNKRLGSFEGTLRDLYAKQTVDLRVGVRSDLLTVHRHQSSRFDTLDRHFDLMRGTLVQIRDELKVLSSHATADDSRWAEFRKIVDPFISRVDAFIAAPLPLASSSAQVPALAGGG